MTGSITAPVREPLRVALIGAGMIAAVHVASARAAGANVVGVLDSSPASSKKAAERWGLSTGFHDLDHLLGSEVDVVHVCTPNVTHYEYALRVLRAGRHLVCEKPVALSSRDAQRLVDEAAAAGVVATVPFVYRYYPLVREIRARGERGDFGTWRLLHGSYLQDWLMDRGASNWRVDPAAGGPSRVFADVGSHWFDLVEWVTGEEVLELNASSSIAVAERGRASESFSRERTTTASATVSTEDSALVMGRTRSGVPVSFVASQVAPGRKNRLWFELDGETTSAAFDQENPEQAWLGRENGAEILVRGTTDSAEARRLSTLPAGHPMGYGDAFAAFVADTYDAIGGGSPQGLPTLVDGLRAAKLTEAFLASAAARSWTEV